MFLQTDSHKGSNPTQQTQTPKKHPDPENGNNATPSPSTTLCTMNSKPRSRQPTKPRYNSKLVPSQAFRTLFRRIVAPFPPFSGPPPSPPFCTSDSLHVLAGAVPLLTLWRPPCGMCSVRSLTSKERLFSWAATRICRPGRARVITNNRLVDLNIENLFRVDDGRIEVVANGLPMWGS